MEKYDQIPQTKTGCDEVAYVLHRIGESGLQRFDVELFGELLVRAPFRVPIWLGLAGGVRRDLPRETFLPILVRF
jgi:hypothetical protein